MSLVLQNGNVFVKDRFVKTNVFICDGIVVSISNDTPLDTDTVFDMDNYFIFPGFIDVHTHLREPGFFYKETVESGTKAAAHGGFTSICSMPNLNPVPDSVENINKQLDIIKKDALINVYPYGSITKGEAGNELSDIFKMRNSAIAYSDDGRGVQSDGMMKKAMEEVKKVNKILAAHCEVNDLLNGGYIHDGEYARLHNHKGICSESEYAQIARDIELAKKTGVKYHVCHISTKESVELIRQAKKDGVDITCETGPHYLVFDDMDLQEDGRFKMNPPIRSKEDKKALIEGIIDGTIDMIATDHAPHSAEEKSKGLEKSNMGVVGLETSFGVMYTHFVKTGIITLEKLVKLLNTNAKKRFGIGTEIKVGDKADITVFDLNEEYKVNPDEFLSKGKSTPFEGMNLYGKCKMTICNGRIIWNEILTEN